MSQSQLWWSAASVLSQWLYYLCLVATVAGPIAGKLLSPDVAVPGRYRELCRYYILIAAMMGLITVIAHFFIQVGLMAESGLAGAANPLMVKILWASNVGDLTLIRAVGFTVLILATILSVIWQRPMRLAAVWTCGVASLLYSMTLSGHLVNQPIWLQSALVLHVAIASWWLGSLIPLVLACKTFSIATLYAMMTQFGRVASIALIFLVLAGGAMAWRLLSRFEDFWQTPYGVVLMLKMLVLVAMLLMAARHKWGLVPSLTSQEDSLRLKRSIIIEAGLAGLLLMATATLTTVVGPNS